MKSKFVKDATKLVKKARKQVKKLNFSDIDSEDLQKLIKQFNDVDKAIKGLKPTVKENKNGK